jgi:hypothetical protein
MTPEARARQTIDALLMQAGWHVCNMADANIHAARGVALREFPLNTGCGFADYLLRTTVLALAKRQACAGVAAIDACRSIFSEG